MTNPRHRINKVKFSQLYCYFHRPLRRTTSSFGNSVRHLRRVLFIGRDISLEEVHSAWKKFKNIPPTIYNIFNTETNFISSRSPKKAGMDLLVELLILIFSIAVLQVYNAFFKIIDDHKTEKKRKPLLLNKSIFKRLTNAGKIYVVLIIVALILNILDAVSKNSERKKTNQTIVDIKNAITAAGLTYDSISKKITNNNIKQIGALNIANVSNVQMENVSAVYKPPHEVDTASEQEAFTIFSEPQLNKIIQRVNKASIQYKTKCVLLYIMDPMKQIKHINQLREKLNFEGYSVNPKTGIYEQKQPDSSIYIDLKGKCIGIFVPSF